MLFRSLHARPASIFVQRANKFRSEVTLRKGRQEVSGKSIIGIMTLAAQKGNEIIVRADGEDAKKAVDELVELLLVDIDKIPVKRRSPRREPQAAGKKDGQK